MHIISHVSHCRVSIEVMFPIYILCGLLLADVAVFLWNVGINDSLVVLFQCIYKLCSSSIYQTTVRFLHLLVVLLWSMIYV